LTRNYRSTETILEASFQVIKDQQVNLPLGARERTYSDIRGIPTISVLETPSARAEAVAIGRAIESMVGGTGFHSIYFDKLDEDKADATCGFSDFAVLCRTGDQVQAIIRQLVSAGIPCQMVNRRLLRQPATAKLLAAFRVAGMQGSYADVNLLTDLCAPGISKETLGIFKQWAYTRQLPLTTALHSAHRLPIPNMSTARQQRLVALVRLLEEIKQACGDLSAAEALAHIATRTTLSSKVEREDLERLTALAQPFGRDKQAFGAALAIDRDTDLYQPGVEKVSVMTLHASKGLEFSVVFVAGCENNILPYRRPGTDDVDQQEERRLFYVGMTRARKQLFLTWARRRTLYGQTQNQQLSPFVLDIAPEIRTHSESRTNAPKPKQEQLALF
jgi:superfamily I DNA/RNA helicase